MKQASVITSQNGPGNDISFKIRASTLLSGLIAVLDISTLALDMSERKLIRLPGRLTVGGIGRHFFPPEPLAATRRKESPMLLLIEQCGEQTA